MELLNEELWGGLIDELTHAASIQQSPLVSEVEAAVADLRQNLSA